MKVLTFDEYLNKYNGECFFDQTDDDGLYGWLLVRGSKSDKDVEITDRERLGALTSALDAIMTEDEITVNSVGDCLYDIEYCNPKVVQIVEMSDEEAVAELGISYDQIEYQGETNPYIVLDNRYTGKPSMLAFEIRED